ncbi:hypothetical protein Vadar_012296 [Vaccinium darrowii]|uniref:Uncharacterized protein n=1 Tax=Vaccinium darrowii TaxID=229202 RepID=A0ACB7XHB6_9ERIC|nr:hypothetical protein Vadar_012296 [Vaccinium darrowii]
MADQGNDESIWVSTEASIRCTHKSGSSNALTTFSNLPDNESDGLGNFAITVKEETNKEEAVAIFSHQQSYNHPSILRTHSINKTRSGQILTMTERVPPLSFQQWLNKPGLKHWEMALDGSIVGLSDEVRKVLKQVGDGLKTMMFTRNQFHGRLEEGIRVSSAGDVKVVIMSPRRDNLTNFEFEEGLKTDIGVFKNLIEKIEVVRPLHSPRPPFLVLFHLLCDKALSLSGKALRDVAYFVYTNAAFYTDEEKIKLIFKLEDFLDTNFRIIGNLLNFNKEPVNMKNWVQTILQEPIFSPLRVSFRNEKWVYENRNHGIFMFYRNTLGHFSDNDLQHEVRQRRLATMKMLSRVFPEFIPKLFFLVATEVRENEAKFGEQDALTGDIVNNDLVVFLRQGRDALP